LFRVVTENNFYPDAQQPDAMCDENALEQAKKLVAAAKKISALTGAGISVDSGIPDFRSEGGIWERFDPHEYGTYDSFLNDPSKFWTMGRELAKVMLKAKPNPAHVALAELEQSGKLLGIITQNIDNLHQVAGNTNVIELHGSYLRAYCMECKTEFIGEEVHRRVADGEIPPRCEKCGGVLKSEAVLFGEPMPKDPMARAVDICKDTDLMLVIGTSLSVYPAAFLPQLAKNSGAKVILINLAGTNRDSVADVILMGKASDVVPGLFDSSM